jgi:hypothetical protein
MLRPASKLRNAKGVTAATRIDDFAHAISFARISAARVAAIALANFARRFDTQTQLAKRM